LFVISFSLSHGTPPAPLIYDGGVAGGGGGDVFPHGGGKLCVRESSRRERVVTENN